MKSEYGVVLIGCGHIGEAHLSDIYYREKIRVVGVVDLLEENARLFARKYGAQSYGTDYKPYLKRDDVDIVIIATYVATHLPILKDCLAAGKHVICEKPIAGSLEEGKEFYHEVKAHPECKVLVAHILRYNDTYRKVAEMIHNGAIGEVRLIRMAQNHHIMNRERYAALLRDCPPIVDCGVHYLDIIRWFTGMDIVSLSGVGCRIGDVAPEDTYNYGLLTMQLENGASAYYEAAWADTTASYNLKEFVGDKGRIRLVLQDYRTQDHEEGDLIEYFDAKENIYHTINIRAKYKNMWGQLQGLIEMIENDTDGFPTIDDVFIAYRLALLGDQAIKERRFVDLRSDNELLQ
ncbi:MAG: Gfo/Idh/MocA family oxidoreductase [Oscillospiraceae bacterium]|jgi:predicted dehydrogenase|nr:Gfo/Idh/MocA family oxidoreductase [Oscillospiraceae bacterium]